MCTKVAFAAAAIASLLASSTLAYPMNSTLTRRASPAMASGVPTVGAPLAAKWYEGTVTPHEHEILPLGYVSGMCGYYGDDLLNAAGQRELTHVVSAHDHDGHSGCNTCLKLTGPKGSTYVLVIDQKADPGLDVSATAYNILFGTQLGPSGASIPPKVDPITNLLISEAQGGPASAQAEPVDITFCTTKWTGKCPHAFFGNWCQ